MRSPVKYLSDNVGQLVLVESLMPYPLFDRRRLKLQPLAQRVHDLDLSQVLPLDHPVVFSHPSLQPLAEQWCDAQRKKAACVLLMGAHVLRAGVQKFLIDLMERGMITLLAMNGAGPIHDWELSLIGATTESVARYVRTGEFGLWQETGIINDVIACCKDSTIGLGEALGQAILDRNHPYAEYSILATAYRLGIPVTVHLGMGYDIIHEHPNACGATLGQGSYTDFLIFAEHVRRLEGGLVLNLGSAVMGPEVFLKALTMARNLAHQENQVLKHFTTAVFDLVPIQGDFHLQADKSDPQYYFRPWKTLLVRTVADGGVSHYITGDHRQTFPALHQAVLHALARTP